MVQSNSWNEWKNIQREIQFAKVKFKFQSNSLNKWKFVQQVNQFANVRFESL